MTKVRLSQGCCGGIFVAAATFLLLSIYPFASLYGASGSGGFRILSVKHISAAQGKKYLDEVGVGTVSQLPGSPALLVTGGAEGAAKAQAVLDIVDGPEEYVVRVILSDSGELELPSAEAISEKVGGIGIVVGTFSNPPKGTGRGRAIIDIHNGYGVIIAPSHGLDRIVSAIEQLQGSAPTEPSRKEPPVQPKKVDDAPKIEVVRPADANKPKGAGDPGKGQTPKSITVGAKQTAPKQKTEAKRPLSIPNAAPDADQVLKMQLPEKLEIVHLLGLVGKYMNLNFMYDPLKIKGEVTLMLTGDLEGPMKVGDLYPLLESVLKFKALGMTRRGNIVTIVPIAEVLPTDPAIVETEEDQISDLGNVIVTRIFKLEHVDAASAQNLLAGMNLGTNVSPIENAKILFVTGYAYRMPRVERLLKMIDKPGRPKTIRFRQCEYTMATALAPKIKTLAEQLGTVSITVGQISSSAVATPTAKRPGETSAAYAARAARERATRTAPRPVAGGAAAAAPGVYLDADERTNRILMIGFADELDSVEELIDVFDTPQIDLRTLKLYQIEHVDAEQAQKKLQELGIVSGSGAGSSSSSTGRITSTSRAGVPTKSTSTASRLPATTSGTGTSFGPSGLVEEPLVVIIEATNSLLVNATAEQHTQIETILKYVDARTEIGTIPYVIYALENQTPTDLGEILEKLIQETVRDKEGKIEKVVKKTDEEIVIVPDENTFSIIVNASKKNQEWISNLIETLDKRRPQVLIDVTLVEVTKGDAFEYDLNLINSFPNLEDTSGRTSPLMGDPNGTGSLIGKLLASTRDRFIDFSTDFSPKGLGGTGFYADRHINVLLTAMQKKEYGRIMAKPKILVNDNETGTISTTETKYVTKTSSIPVSSGGAGTQSTLIQTAVDYEGYDAGITLDITPHISEGDLLRLEITLTRSDFNQTFLDKPPDTIASDITTVVTVPDGSTIILGGMITMRQGKTGKKVPFLGDLPLIGALFRSVSDKDEQRRLYIFVKAEIIRPAETLAQGLPDLEEISQRNRLSFEKWEQKFQSYQSFPGIKAKPLEPIKVLDDE